MKKRRIIHVLAIFMMIGLQLSCSESNIGTNGNSEEIKAESLNSIAAKQAQKDSPEKVFSEFEEMLKKVEKMSKEEIDSLSDEEVLEIGQPILKATEHTIKLSKASLERLSKISKIVKESLAFLAKEDHKKLSEEVKQILPKSSNYETRSLTADDVRQLLEHFNGGEESLLLSTCETMFNVQNGNVYLTQGDNFSTANNVCPSGTYFFILPYTHQSQAVGSSKNGNRWIGYSGAVMDGQQSRIAAFSNGMNNNTLSWFGIKNYISYGIFSGSGSENVTISSIAFENIGPGLDGQEFGAIRFNYAENVRIQYSSFENVTSGIRFVESDGPIKVLDNEALNTGRNYFQCNNCQGSGIRINGNSLEHTSQYGEDPLEDFINIFESSGTNSDYIQVNNNRARINLTNGNANGVASSGCFIILGDYGGQYQEAKSNIGVNPGNCGIGVAGGFNFRVEDNLMFSQRIIGISNVGIYGAAFPKTIPCSFGPSTFKNNKSSFICGKSDGSCADWDNNWAWAPETPQDDHYCGVTTSQIQDDSRVKKDLNLGPGIWNQW